MINCDQAFEFLTSQDSKSNTELNRHLADCPRCREMAEVLSPALSELDAVRQYLDSEPPMSKRDESSGVQVAIRAAEHLKQQVAAEPKSRRSNSLINSRILLTTLVFMVGLSGGWSLSLLRSDNISQTPTASVFTSNDCSWITRANVGSQTPRTVTLTCMACHLPLDAYR